MTATLRERIYQDKKTAMRTRDAKKGKVLGVLWADIVQIEVDQRIAKLEDAQILQILSKRLKQAKESEDYARRGQREDIIEEILFEQSILQEYLPKPLTEAAVDDLIQQAIQEVKASTIKDLGQVMNWLKARLQGQADLTKVVTKVKEAIDLLQN